MARVPKTINQADIEILGNDYLNIAASLDAPPLPDIVYGQPDDQNGLPKDQAGRLFFPKQGPRALTTLDIIIRLQKTELRGKNINISKYNASLGAKLGGTALMDLHERAVERDVTLENPTLEALSKHIRGLRENLRYAMHNITKPPGYNDAWVDITDRLFEKKLREGEDTPYFRLNPKFKD